MDTATIVTQIGDAINSGRQIESFSKRGFELSFDTAYKIASRARASFDTSPLVGRKIGFTNRGIWSKYGVDQPIWGDISNASVSHHEDGQATIELSSFCEPRIEPEVVICLKSAPSIGSDNKSVAACIDWIAPGLEIVHSIYPRWSFSLADSIASGGLHGRLIVGKPVTASKDLERSLIDLKVSLFNNGVLNETGSGANVLDGPISAIRFLMEGLENYEEERSLSPGDIISTGTMTDAKPVKVGEQWSAKYSGVINTSLGVSFI